MYVRLVEGSGVGGGGLAFVGGMIRDGKRDS